MLFGNVLQWILKLQNCERVGRAALCTSYASDKQALDRTASLADPRPI